MIEIYVDVYFYHFFVLFSHNSWCGLGVATSNFDVAITPSHPCTVGKDNKEKQSSYRTGMQVE